MVATAQHVECHAREWYDGGMITTTVLEAGGKAPEAIMYMPAGVHRVCATVNGQAQERTVRVDAAACDVLQTALAARLEAHAQGKQARPCGMFDHVRGAAAFIPQGFEWDPDRGVLLRVRWTDAGRRAVEGGDYSYFSPHFALDSDTERVAGLVPDSVEIGSLVNDPAFTRIEQIAASRVGAQNSANLATAQNVEKNETAQHNVHMDEIKKMLGLPPDADDAAVLDAVKRLKDAGDKDKGAAEANAERAQKAEAEAVAAKDEAKKKEEELCAMREKLQKAEDEGADAFVSMACASGKIAPKDDEAKASWKALYKADRVSAQKALSALPVNPALAQVTASKGQPELSKERSLRELCQAEIDVMKK